MLYLVYACQMPHCVKYMAQLSYQLIMTWTCHRSETYQGKKEDITRKHIQTDTDVHSHIRNQINRLYKF